MGNKNPVVTNENETTYITDMYLRENFDFSLLPFHSLYTFGLYPVVFGGFSKFSKRCQKVKTFCLSHGQITI